MKPAHGVWGKISAKVISSCQIISLRSKLERSGTSLSVIILRGYNAQLNCACHWLVKDHGDYRILPFDMAYEVFRIFKMPVILWRLRMEVAVLHEYIALITSSYEELERDALMYG